ncbi:MAG TPA: M1 family metallopeptidase [Flavilitoribacter sp.]|nr:M1 family metallopeptidase [Flavilitoribacter sp.]HMQ89156.1 M1 family metallopeptidase [Flavilitoribacter sp.]
MQKRHILLLTFALFMAFSASAQVTQRNFTHQDTLRGSITPERAWWDLQHYDLNFEVDPAGKTIKGVNTMRYKVTGPQNRMQIDLQLPMQLTKAVQNGQELKIEHDGNAHFLTLTAPQKEGATLEVALYYEGSPRVARRPPWDGGITWSTDENGLPFIATSCQGLGASVWWPCKDHMYDEPDQGMMISVETPENLMDVSNGRLVKTDSNPKKKTKTWHWQVVNPINNYGVNINIGDYVHFGEKYDGEKGPLDMDYYVLRNDLEKAKSQFKDAVRTMQALEHWFGPYPFYEDSYKLVQTPYLGMEHQSSVTYGNRFGNGYLGRDLSGSGWGLKFDFIIIHESAHEWFANNVTYKDMADMWIHESFANYSESLFVEYHYGKDAGNAYVRGTRSGIRNDRPIIGPYDVNRSGSGDMYPKGGNMLHTIRQIVNDDEKWRSVLRGLGQEFYHQTVTTAQVENYISEKSGIDLSKVFDQYLRQSGIPILEYEVKDKTLRFRWNEVVNGFDMPVKVKAAGKEIWLHPTPQWAETELDSDRTDVVIDPDFYVAGLNITGQ